MPLWDGCRKPSLGYCRVLALRASILMPSDPPGLRAPLAWQHESLPIGSMSHAGKDGLYKDQILSSKVSHRLSGMLARYCFFRRKYRRLDLSSLTPAAP